MSVSVTVVVKCDHCPREKEILTRMEVAHAERARTDRDLRVEYVYQLGRVLGQWSRDGVFAYLLEEGWTLDGGDLCPECGRRVAGGDR